jgi:hypothetical protein
MTDITTERVGPSSSPLIQLHRSDKAVKLYRRADGYTVEVARLKECPEVLQGLTADEALDALAEEMRGR